MISQFPVLSAGKYPFLTSMAPRVHSETRKDIPVILSVNEVMEYRPGEDRHGRASLWSISSKSSGSNPDMILPALRQGVALKPNDNRHNPAVKKISMLFSSPGGGRFSRAPPFMKSHRIHVHQSPPTVPSFVREAGSQGACFDAALQ